MTECTSYDLWVFPFTYIITISEYNLFSVTKVTASLNRECCPMWSGSALHPHLADTLIQSFYIFTFIHPYQGPTWYSNLQPLRYKPSSLPTMLLNCSHLSLLQALSPPFSLPVQPGWLGPSVSADSFYANVCSSVEACVLTAQALAELAYLKVFGGRRREAAWLRGFRRQRRTNLRPETRQPMSRNYWSQQTPARTTGA